MKVDRGERVEIEFLESARAPKGASGCNSIRPML